MSKSILACAGLLLAAGVVPSMFSGCQIDCIVGSGIVSSTERTVSEFHSLVLESSADVYIVQASSSSGPNVRIEAEENILPILDTDVSNGVLTIDTRWNDCYWSNQPVKIYVTMPGIRRIDLRGSGSIVSEGMLTGDELEVALPGSGTIALELDVEVVDVSLDGSGEIALLGAAPELEVSLNGSGNVRGFDLNSMNAAVRLDGSGNIQVQASETLKVVLNGSGNVFYHGNPHLTVSGGGSGQVVDAN